MDNYIIELRNKDTIDSLRVQGSTLQEGDGAGQWTTNIQAGANLMLQEGDTLICRNSYIDTKAESEGKIVILEDTPINVQFYYYANNWNGVIREYVNGSTWKTKATSQKIAINASDNVIQPFSDGELYLACEVSATGQNFRFQKSITYQGQNALQGVGGFNVSVQYVDINGDTQQRNFYLPEYFEVGWGTEAQQDINITYDHTKKPAGQSDPIAVYRSVQVDGKWVADLNIRLDGTRKEIDDTIIMPLTDQTTLNNKLYTPKIGFVNFTLPAGAYTPDELCEQINQSMVKTGDNPPTALNLNDNQLLVSIAGQDKNGDSPNTQFNNFIKFQAQDDETQNSYGYQYSTDIDAGEPNILGASQFTLTYDEDTSKFGFSYLHTPVYSNADGTDGGDAELGGLCSARGWTGDQQNKPNPTLPENRFRVGKNCGILLVDLQPRELWMEQLGFDLDKFIRDQTGKPTNTPNPDCILVGCTQKAKNNNGDDFTINNEASSRPLFYSIPKDGKHMTNGFLGVSTVFEKGKDFQKQITLDDTSAEGQSVSHFVGIGTDTVEIAAGASVLDADNQTTTFGYFLVEVQGNFTNNYLNQSGNFKHIVSIVSRYYSKQNYTSSTSADSIVYTHKGDPVLLNSFNCRILDSKKQLAQNIGEDNTVILELIKATPQVKSGKK